ncbi:metallophosphoesterase [Niastella yeongjuensis]|uniref:Metallophosphoesterase n=1 Tax=Niastella yeongjuensis TaxID=354355 RepID=A0A1V9E1H3_9BACT|nr:metallophosphoesterase [Niastella yeongjuensis]OQP39977.1 metallophosphoesterase [Niastella yeongjuensis]SEO12311.1 3',5'-cyclic AMP phosphodiesterase CpdA [Niastella yeongjuensis]
MPLVRKVTYPVFKKNQPDDSFKFKPLPEPTGKYPFHLDLHSVIPNIGTEKMVFHMVGDTGSLYGGNFQRIVAGEMKRQYLEAPALKDKPQFLYHLGDVVYTYGEAANYYPQFFEPYRDYPGPVFAIPGNHDGDINPNAKPYNSLDAFMKVFCDVESRPVPFSVDVNRKSMIQPNVYWTLETPLANIIGLYGNTTKFGTITDQQRDWFIRELKIARSQGQGKALIVCVHHAPYSADSNHGASAYMIEFLENAFIESGVLPDIVFSGHVHNYQRFSRQYANGSMVRYIVAGAGGYDDLHSLVKEGDKNFAADDTLTDQVRLEHFCDDRHGFLKISIEKTDKGVLVTGEYFSIPHEARPGQETTSILTDKFEMSCSG